MESGRPVARTIEVLEAGLRSDKDDPQSLLEELAAAYRGVGRDGDARRAETSVGLWTIDPANGRLRRTPAGNGEIWMTNPANSTLREEILRVAEGRECSRSY